MCGWMGRCRRSDLVEEGTANVWLGSVTSHYTVIRRVEYQYILRSSHAKLKSKTPHVLLCLRLAQRLVVVVA